MAIQQPRSKSSGSETPEAGAARSRSSSQFLQETITELKKTTWPTRQEANRLTSVVIGIIVVLGIYMGLLDAVLSFLVNRFSLIK